MAHKKIGRPKATNPLDYGFRVRLDKETAEELEEYRKAAGLKKAAAVRKIIREKFGIEDKK